MAQIGTCCTGYGRNQRQQIKMIAQSKSIISLKAGLYLRIAKLKGYSVIEYTPTQNDVAIFSINCRLDCKLHSCDITRLACASCGEELNLYRDPVMEQFTQKVRIDLLDGRFRAVSTKESSWENLTLFESQQLTHIQYFKALQKIKDAELRACLINYYSYQVMPVPTPKSFWGDYYQLIDHCYCVYVNQHSQRQKLWVLFDQGSKFLLQLENELEFALIDCAYSQQFLALLYQTKSTILAVYQLPQFPPLEQKPIEPIYKFQLPSGSAQLTYSLYFQYQRLSVLSFNPQSKITNLYQIQNVISSAPQLQHVLQDLFQGTNNNQTLPEPEHIFPFLVAHQDLGLLQESEVGFLRITKNRIELHRQNKLVAIENEHKITRVDGLIANVSKSKQYFYQIHETGVTIIVFSYSSDKLTSIQMKQEDFVFQFINQEAQPEKNYPKILFRRPMIDGCIYFLHYLHLGEIKLGKSCIV